MTNNIWFGVNRSGTLMMFTSEPTRNNDAGRWEGESYCNSVLESQLLPVIKESGYSWNNEAECIMFKTE